MINIPIPTTPIPKYFYIPIIITHHSKNEHAPNTPRTPADTILAPGIQHPADGPDLHPTGAHLGADVPGADFPVIHQA